MNISEQLPAPLSDFIIDIPQNTYYDFELPLGSTYPLGGVTYSVDYGHIPGYTAEDKKELDLFVGAELDGQVGYVLVSRGEDMPDEHKFYVGLTDADVEAICAQLKPVLIEQKPLLNMHELIDVIKIYKNDVQ